MIINLAIHSFSIKQHVWERIILQQIISPIVEHNKIQEAMATYIIIKINSRTQNNTLKTTATRVTPFAEPSEPNIVSSRMK